LDGSDHGSENGGSSLDLTGPKVHKFAITGGPCSGKTTAMERIQSFMRERGFRVFIVPEAATILFLNGASPDDLAKPECQLHFQRFVISTQVALEDEIMDYARSTGEKSLVLCDRGVLDGAAYVDEKTFDEILKYKGMNIVNARDNRYDAIFHLVTAANGAERFYNLDNKARWESPEEAKRLDLRTQQAWHGHPQHVIIDNTNSKSFDHKIERLIGVISTYVGLPSLTRRSHKFILSGKPNFALLPNVQIFDVEKIMLSASFKGLETSPSMSEDGFLAMASLKEPRNPPTQAEESQELYSFVRKRTIGKLHSYGLTTVKRYSSNSEKMELKQVINSRMYNLLGRSSDKKRDVVRQRRYCFLWQQQSFQIIEYTSPVVDFWILRVQCEGEPVLPPPEFGLATKPWDESEIEAMSSYALSLKSSKARKSSFDIVGKASSPVPMPFRETDSPLTIE